MLWFINRFPLLTKCRWNLLLQLVKLFQMVFYFSCFLSKAFFFFSSFTFSCSCLSWYISSLVNSLDWDWDPLLPLPLPPWPPPLVLTFPFIFGVNTSWMTLSSSVGGKHCIVCGSKFTTGSTGTTFLLQALSLVASICAIRSFILVSTKCSTSGSSKSLRLKPNQVI